MRAWSGEGAPADGMGPSVTRAGSGRPTSPPLKNGSELREAGYLISVGSRTARFRRKHKHKLLFVILLALLLLLLCLFILMTILYVRQKKAKPIRVCESKECLRSAANLALSMDRTADPCSNFYQYTCGNWAEEHPRPDSLHSYDWFRDKQSRVYALVRDALSRNDSRAQTPPRPVICAKQLYDACMDIETLNKRGLKPVLTVLESLGLPPYPAFINVTEDVDYSTFTFDWLETVIKVKTQLGMDVLIGFDIFTDPKNSSQYRLVMGSPETTNPFPSMHNDRKRHYGQRNIVRQRKALEETFIRIPKRRSNSEDEHDEKTAQVYKLFYAELMKLFVLESGDQKNSKLSETELDANLLITASEHFEFNNDVYDLESDNDTDVNDESYLNIPEYTAMELQKLTDIAIHVNNESVIAEMAPVWTKYLDGVFSVSEVKLDHETDKILVSEPDLKYLVMMTAVVVRTPPVTLQLYIWMKVVEVMAIHTTSEVRALLARARQAARRTGGGGGDAADASARSLHCANAANDMMGMAVAYAIADPHFLNVTKPKIETMLHEMKNALAHLVGKARWMDDDTKLATYQKIVQMKTLVGFPDWLLEEGALEAYYEGIEVDSATHLENMVNIIQIKIKKALSKFREGNNFTWATDPTEVNAYHTFQENTITVPLVMLQYPFFDLGLDSLNYGSLGTILGHEITHGFDNFGRMFDKNGNLVAWWSNETIAAFINMTHCFVDQYSTYYVPQLGEHVNGKKTLGENIADNGGVREALAALHRHLRRFGPEPKLPGFEHMSSDQLFFLSYGNLWCGVWTQESLQMDLADEHAPQQFRAEGALRNTAEFARAWRCPPGSPMNPRPDQRCVIF